MKIHTAPVNDSHSAKLPILIAAPSMSDKIVNTAIVINRLLWIAAMRFSRDRLCCHAVTCAMMLLF